MDESLLASSCAKVVGKRMPAIPDLEEALAVHLFWFGDPCFVYGSRSARR